MSTASTTDTAANTTAPGKISVWRDGPIGWIAIDNPARRNAVGLAMWEALPEAVDQLCAQAETRIIVLRGAGDSIFVAGADISEFETTHREPASARAYEASNTAAFAALRNCPLPTLAMVRGFCLGGGLGLAAACDMRIADRTARFGIPASRLGVGYPPSAIADVTRLIGPSRAKLLYFSARRITAETALEFGLIDLLAADGALEEETIALAQEIATRAPLTIKASKTAIDALTASLAPADLLHCEALANACFDSADFAEGRTAFMEKRDPVFQGR